MLFFPSQCELRLQAYAYERISKEECAFGQGSNLPRSDGRLHYKKEPQVETTAESLIFYIKSLECAGQHT